MFGCVHEDRRAVSCIRLKRFFHTVHLKAWILLFLLVAFLFISALGLYALENPGQVAKMQSWRKELEELREKFSANISAKILNTTEFILFVEPDRYARIAAVIQSSLREYEAALHHEPNHGKEWTFWNSTFYALSLLTTVGNTQIQPVTFEGQILAVFCSVMGIPVLLSTLGEFAKLFMSIFDRTVCTLHPEDLEFADSLELWRQRKVQAFFHLLATVVFLLILLFGTVMLINHIKDPYLSFWDSFYAVILTFCTIELPQHRQLKETEMLLPILAGTALTLVLVSVAVRLLGFLLATENPYEITPMIRRDRSMTLSSEATATCQKVSARMSKLSPMGDIVREFPPNPPCAPAMKRREIEVDAAGVSRLTLTDTSDVTPSFTQHGSKRSARILTPGSAGVHEDERAWLAQIGTYSESDIADELKPDYEERQFYAYASHSR